MPREVFVLATIAFSVAIGFGVVAPAIPVFARDFGVGHTAAAAVISAFAFMRFVSALGGGRLVDRLGERTVLSAGTFFVAISTSLAGAAQSYLQLLLLRAVGGIGSAMFTVAAVSLLLRVVDAEHRGRANGLFQGGFLAGGLMGPVVGGVLTEVSPRVPFFVYGASLAVASVIGTVFLAKVNLHDRAAGKEEAEERTTLREAFGNRAYRAALVTNLGTGWALFGVRSSLVPLFVVEGMKVGAIWTGIGFLVSSLVQAVLLMPVGRFVDTVGRRPAMILGGLMSMAAMLLVTFSSALPAYLLAMGLFGVGSAYLGVAPGAVVGDVVRGRGGQVVAVFQMSADLGSIVGPLVAGMLADNLSFGAAFGATAGILVFGPLLAVRMPETRYAPRPVATAAMQPPASLPAAGGDDGPCRSDATAKDSASR
ncbi:MFS transporter [Actinopolymorpha alba]|uniref:MFS transporter n=1 Tax=Actinopolymorpha alba TaxID=533267 RepID=UPI000377991F|nr:MFS transporter [Actinopolymorpha alba]